MENVKTRQACIDICLNFYKFSAFNVHLAKCLCFKRLTKSYKETLLNNNECDGALKYEIYETGSIDVQKLNLSYEFKDFKIIMQHFNMLKENLPRIVFVFTINGRSIRHVLRLIKTIFVDWHFYYIHVDERMTYLRDQLAKFIKDSKKSNIYMANWQM